MHVYSDDVRAQVLAAVAMGTPVLQIAREFHITPVTVRNWRRAAGLDGLPLVNREKRSDLGELIGEYLRTGLEALTAQARVATDPEWIKKQPADQLAIFHGVLADKLVRVLAALEPVTEPDVPPVEATLVSAGA